MLVCPSVTEICSTQASQESTYYLLTEQECDAMKAVEIGMKCVSIDRYDIDARGNGLSNRVCYEESVAVIADSNKCGTCRDTIDISDIIIVGYSSSGSQPDDSTENQGEDIILTRRMLRGN